MCTLALTWPSAALLRQEMRGCTERLICPPFVFCELFFAFCLPFYRHFFSLVFRQTRGRGASRLILETFIFISGQLETQIVLSAVWTTVELILDLFPSVFTLLLQIPEASFSWEDYWLPGSVKQFHISWMLS